MSSHGLSRGSRQQVLWRAGAAMLLALLAAIFTSGTSQAAPLAQAPGPCPQPGVATIIDPAGGAVQVRMYVTNPATAANDPTSIQRIALNSGPVLYAFCIDSTEARLSNVASCLLSEISNVRLAYLIAKYPPSLTDRIAQAARQAAIWHFSNGKNLDLANATTEGAAVDTAVANMYTALVNEINAIDPANPPAIMRPGALALTVTPATAINQLPQQSAHQITVTLTKGGFPLPGIQVQVTATLGQFDQTTATTDANGQARFTLTSTSAGTANITAAAQVTVPKSYEYVVQQDPTGLQPFGVPGSTTETVTGTATKEWRSSTTVTPTSTPTATPTNTPTSTPTATPPTPTSTPTPTWTPTSTPTSTPPVPGRYAVGNLVWLDVAGVPHDGIQQTIEQTSGGVNGVRVELYDGGGTFLSSQLTGLNSSGQPGYYLFTDLLPGSYQVRFCLPDGYSPTLQNQGGDDMLDSDGNSSGSNATCSYYQTEVFDLPNSLTVNNADLSRDFGLWRPTDFGDNPDTPVQYPTRARSLRNPADAARHIIVPGLHFGNLVDAEDDGQPTTPANGDDNNGPINDEDGVVFLTPLQPCTTAQVQLTALTSNQVANYGAFFDWNGDGVFGPGEGFTGTIGTPATPSETKVITIPVPCSAVQLVYMRFRLAYSAAEVQTATGTATTGEVEDYVLAAIGDRVWYDKNKDGLQGDVTVEPGVPGVVATLCNGSTGQPMLYGGKPLTTTTDANGIYGFYNVPLASYCVLFDLATLPPDYVVTKQNAGSDDSKDSDADARGHTGATAVLTPSQLDLSLDMGIYYVSPTAEQPTNEPPAGTFRLYLPDLRQQPSR